MRTLPLWVLATTVALHGCALDAPEGGDLGASQRPIIGGSIDIGDYEAVAGIEVQPPLPEDADEGDPLPEKIFCAGTLVGERVVLTAAACVADNAKVSPLVGIDVRFGDSFSSGEAIAVEAVEVERYYGGGANGLALLRLATAPTGVDPVAVNDEPLGDDFVGTEVALVGFGATVSGDDPARQRHVVSLPVRSVNVGGFIAGTDTATTCVGDSGAPAFVGDVVFAITAGTSSCDAAAPRTRVDLAAAGFIHAYVDRFEGACPQDDTCTTAGCRTPDPDCDPCSWDGACTEDCPTRDVDCPLGGFVGDACAADGECEEGGRCIPANDDPEFTFCTRACDDADATACPEAMACEDGECTYEGPSPGSQGAACSGGDQCRSGICEDLICVTECDPTAADACAAPYTCGPSDEAPGKNVCLGADLDGGGGFCAAAGGAGSTAAWLLLLGATLVVARRRRA